MGGALKTDPYVFKQKIQGVVRKSVPIKHALSQISTLLQSLRGFLKINEIICVTWL